MVRSRGGLVGAGQAIVPVFLSLEALRYFSSFLHLSYSLPRVVERISDKDSLLDQTLGRLLSPFKEASTLTHKVLNKTEHHF